MTFYVSASIGLAFASGEDPYATAETLVRDADTAMYQAKDAGRDAVAMFDQSMRARVEERVELERDLHDAVAMDQLHLVYQPIVRLPQGTVVGMEALVRWSHPSTVWSGRPSSSRWPRKRADRGDRRLGPRRGGGPVRRLAAAGPDMADLYVSVNVSGVQLHDDHIVSGSPTCSGCTAWPAILPLPGAHRVRRHGGSRGRGRRS